MNVNRMLKRKQKRIVMKQIRLHLKKFRTLHGLNTPDKIKAYALYRSNLYHEMGIKNKYSENHIPLPVDDTVGEE